MSTRSGRGSAAVLESVDFLSFDAYTIADSGGERLYLIYLTWMPCLMYPRQRPIIILYTQPTRVHENARLSADDMGKVARATYAFAKAQPDVASILCCTWAGGIDHFVESFMRDLPERVRAIHEETGGTILADSCN